MVKILLLSDTHNFLNPKIETFATQVNEIWHAGDIGDIKVLDKLKAMKPVRAVWGNIDGGDLRKELRKELVFELEGLKIAMVHIAGKFGTYNDEVKKLLNVSKPNLLVCGHSHILKVANDSKNKVLYMNPGAAGNHGFHLVSTFLLFEINQGKPENLRVVELGKRGAL